MRPVRAKALIINAFALTGRIAILDTFTQGVCPGLWASAPFGAYCCEFCTPSSYILDFIKNYPYHSIFRMNFFLCIVEFCFLVYSQCLVVHLLASLDHALSLELKVACLDGWESHGLQNRVVLDV